MWILVKLGVAAFFAIMGALVRLWKGETLYGPDGQIYYRRKDKQYFQITVPFRKPVLFSFHRENPFDQYMKALGLASELQTGDMNFDSSVYVSSDHPGVHRLLRDNPDIRTRTCSLLSKGFDARILADGKRLSIRSKAGIHRPEEELVRALTTAGGA